VSEAAVAAQAGRQEGRDPASETALDQRQLASKLLQALPIIAATANASRRLQSTAHGAPAASHVKSGIPLLSANDARRCCRKPCRVLPCLALQTPNEKGSRRPPGKRPGMAALRARQHEQGLPGLHSRTNHHLPLAILRLRAWRRVSPAMIPGRRLSPHGCSNRRRRPRFRYSKLSKNSRYRQAGRHARVQPCEVTPGAHPTAASSSCCVNVVVVWLGPSRSRYVALPSSSLSASQHGRAAAHRGPPSAAALALLAYQQALLDRERRGDVLCCC
jgi:hypothetical protein